MTDLNALLSQLHTSLAKELLARVQSGEATASDLAVVRQFLKDNGVDSVPKTGNPVHNLAQALPFTSEGDDEEAGLLPN